MPVSAGEARNHADDATLALAQHAGMSFNNHRDALRLGQSSIDFRAALWPSRIPRDHVGLITLRTGKIVFWTGRMAIGLHHNEVPVKAKRAVKDRFVVTKLIDSARWLIGRPQRPRSLKARPTSQMVFTLKRVSPKPRLGATVNHRM